LEKKCLHIGVDFTVLKSEITYLGVFCTDGEAELFRRKSDDFTADYQHVYKEAKKIRNGLIICLLKSIWDYSKALKTIKK
jgi:hypothetical protein